MYLWIDHLEIDSKTNFNAEREGKNPYSRNMFSIFTFHQFFFFPYTRAARRYALIPHIGLDKQLPSVSVIG